MIKLKIESGMTSVSQKNVKLQKSTHVKYMCPVGCLFLRIKILAMEMFCVGHTFIGLEFLLIGRI